MGDVIWHGDEFKVRLREKVLRGMQATGHEMERVAVASETRHKTYHLRNSIGSKAQETGNEIEAVVFASAEYALVQEEGNSKFSVPYAGMHFLRKSLDAGQQRVADFIRSA